MKRNKIILRGQAYFIVIIRPTSLFPSCVSQCREYPRTLYPFGRDNVAERIEGAIVCKWRCSKYLPEQLQEIASKINAGGCYQCP
jgi:hypothetical protein